MHRLVERFCSGLCFALEALCLETRYISESLRLTLSRGREQNEAVSVGMHLPLWPADWGCHGAATVCGLPGSRGIRREGALQGTGRVQRGTNHLCTLIMLVAELQMA